MDHDNGSKTASADSRYFVDRQPQKWLSMSSLGSQIALVDDVDSMPVLLSNRKELTEEEDYRSLSSTLVRNGSPSYCGNDEDESSSLTGASTPCSSPDLRDTAKSDRLGSYNVSHQDDEDDHQTWPEPHFDRDTSGYTSNTSSSKDEVVRSNGSEVGGGGDGGCCSSVSMRSSSPESILSGSVNSDTLLPTPPFPTARAHHQNNNYSTKEIKVFSKIPSVDVEGGRDRRRSATEHSHETPIEREIRQAREREEEYSNIRLRRGNLSSTPNSDGAQAETVVKKQTKLNIPNDKLPTNNQDIQRRLATTRLQQEIEEQRRRELDLRRDGRVLSTSQDHIDLPFPPTPDLSELSLSPPLPMSPSPLLQMAPIHKQMELFEAGTKGNAKVVTNMKVPISMEKFFKSSGKVVTNFQPSKSAPWHHDATPYVDYSAVRLRSKEEAVTPKKVYKQAGDKISQELREMLEREEELRSTRTKLGLSVMSGQSVESVEHLVQPSLSSEAEPVVRRERVAANGDFSEKSSRRRSMLVAQWEERIQREV